MATVVFKSIIDIRDGNPYVLVNRDQATTIRPDWRRPIPVLVRVNDKPAKPWHINMMPVGNGSFYLYLHGDIRKASGTDVGDTVEIRLDLDKEYRNGPMHPMPDWFRSALDQRPIAKQNWDNLIPSRQKEILRYFSWLKSDATKDRNLKKAMDVLSGKTGRFMARSWKDGH